MQSWLDYGGTVHAPGRGDGDSGAVLAGHNLLRAHGYHLSSSPRAAPPSTILRETTVAFEMNAERRT